MPTPPEALPAADVIAYVLLDLAIILLAARLVGGLFVKINQPRVVGEMIAGILIGPTVLGGQLARGAITSLDQPAQDGSGLVNEIYPLQAFSFLTLIGTLTLVFFMFLVGLEVQQRFLKGRERQIAVVALTVIAAPIALGFLVGAILDDPEVWKAPLAASGDEVTAGTHALFIAAGLAVTAFPVMARILQEKRMLATDMGAIGIGAAAVVTPLMFLLLAGASASARGDAVGDTVGFRLLLTVALVLVLFLLVRPALGRLIGRRYTEGKPLDLELFAILLLGALLTALAADRIGIHSLNGGFLFGAAVPQVAGLGKAVIDRMQSFVVVLLIPIFLAVSGLQTDLRVLEPSMIGGILLFLAAMIVAKWVAGALAGRAVGLGFRDANVIGVLMNCRGLMILVVALIGRQAGVITEPMQAAFVIGAIVTTIMTGPLVDLFLPKAEVESEREKSLQGSLSGLTAMTGGPRVVVAPDEPALIAPAAEEARRFAERDPSAQFLLVKLPGLLANGDYVGATGEDPEAAAAVARGWLDPIARSLAAAGATAEAVSFQTPAPSADLGRLAAEWAATHAIVADHGDAAAVRDAGIEVLALEAAPGEEPAAAHNA